MKMKVTVLGKEKMQGVSKKTGGEFCGTMVHVTYPKMRCEGKAVETVFIDESYLPYGRIAPDRVYDLDRDGRGYIIGFSEVK